MIVFTVFRKLGLSLMVVIVISSINFVIETMVRFGTYIYIL